MRESVHKQENKHMQRDQINDKHISTPSRDLNFKINEYYYFMTI